MILLLLFAWLPASRADVLFLDMNNSPKEVEAARAATQKSGRKFVVFPDNDPKKVSELNRVKAAISKVLKANRNVCTDPESAPCKSFREKITELSTKEAALKEELELKPAQLEAFLAEREKGKNPLTSVVVSGHDGTGSFSGSLGRITDQTLAEMIGKHPLLAENLRSLHLWGCYTTSPGSLLLNWTAHFPNTALITGFDGRAPLGDKPANWSYLKAVIEKEPDLLKITDHKKLKEALLKLPGASQMHSAIYTCHGDYATISDSYNFQEMPGRCQNMLLELKERAPEYECYRQARKEGCENPPADTGGGPLRKFYELLHKTAPCADFSKNAIFHQYYRETAFRLTFGRAVQGNFLRNYRTEIAEIDASLESLGADPALRFSGLDKMSRKEMLEKTDALLSLIQARTPDWKSNPQSLQVGGDHARILMLSQFHRTLTDTLVSMSEYCVPFDWHEDVSHDKSDCIRTEKLGQSGVAYWLKNDGNLRQSTLGMMLENLEREIKLLSGQERQTGQAIQAREFLLNAYLNRFNEYAWSETPTEAEAAISEPTLAWAKAHLDAVREGKKDPAHIPEVQRLNLDIQEVVLNESLAIQRRTLEELEQKAKFSTPSNNQIDSYREGISSAEKKLRLVALTKQALSTGNLSSEARDQLASLKHSLAHDIHRQEIDFAERQLQAARKELAEAKESGDAESARYYRDRISHFEKSMEAEKKKFARDPLQAIEKFLTIPPGI